MSTSWQTWACVHCRHTAPIEDQKLERFGFIAHELEAVYPNPVGTGTDGLLGIHPLGLLTPMEELAALLAEVENGPPLNPATSYDTKAEKPA